MPKDQRKIQLDGPMEDRRVIVRSAEWADSDQDDFEQPCPDCKLDVKFFRIKSYWILTDKVKCPHCGYEEGGDY